MNYDLLIADLEAEHSRLQVKQRDALSKLETAAAVHASAETAFNDAMQRTYEYAGLIKKLETERDAPTPAEIAARKARAKSALGGMGDLK